MRRFFSFVLALSVAAASILSWLQYDRAPVVHTVNVPTELGRTTPVQLTVDSPGPGLARVRLLAVRDGNVWPLFEQQFTRNNWRGSGIDTFEIRVAPDWIALGVPEGPIQLELWGATYGWHLRGHDRAPLWTQTVTLDFTPPRIELLTTQHNVRLGGVELAIWRQSVDAVNSGVEVGPYFFPSHTGYFADPHLALALFAVPQDLDAGVRPLIVAQDRVGNRAQVGLPVTVARRRFAERTLVLDDNFLARKVPEIEASNGLPSTGTWIERYLRINRDLRRQNEAFLRELGRTTAARPTWDHAFHRQSGAAPLSAFADRRTYVYRSQEVDRQVHLGFDLASVQASPVEAAQTGTVVFAGNLGIYGSTVVLDHGLGVFTLYGHLRRLDVKVGDQVQRGQTLGLTGETGLAAGDHVHYSVMLHGVHVDPVEWWDAEWIRKHLLAKLAAYPRGASATDAKER